MQVEDLTRKSQLLEAEVDKISQQLKDTAAAVKEEAEKNEAAQEIIRSLTARVRYTILSICFGLCMNFHFLD